MKKRKPPILLAAVLLIALGAIVTMNANASSQQAEDEAHKAALEQSQSSEGPSVLQEAPADPTDLQTDMRPSPKGVGIPKDGPKIVQPKVRARTEKPRLGSDLQGQWYAPEAAKPDGN
jgi:hypothetical protein